MLDTASRTAIVGIAAFSLVGAFALVPARARGAVDLSSPQQVAFVAAPQFDPPPIAIEIERDPFESGKPAAIPTPESGAPASTLASASSLANRDIGPLPSNLPASIIPAVPGDPGATSQSTRVTAIVTGAHPYAMLETAGDHVIKGIGDRVGGKPIVAIDIRGVSLAGGERLSVVAGDSAR
jgi:hypothetical protein